MTNVLMDSGIQIEAKDNAGVTALQLAVELGLGRHYLPFG